MKSRLEIEVVAAILLGGVFAIQPGVCLAQNSKTQKTNSAVTPKSQPQAQPARPTVTPSPVAAPPKPTGTAYKNPQPVQKPPTLTPAQIDNFKYSLPPSQQSSPTTAKTISPQPTSKTPQTPRPVGSGVSQKPPALTPAQIDNFKYSLPPSQQSTPTTAKAVPPQPTPKTPQTPRPVGSGVSQKPPALTPAQIDNFKYSLPPSQQSTPTTAKAVPPQPTPKTLQTPRPVGSGVSQKPPTLTPEQIDSFKYSLPPSQQSSPTTAKAVPLQPTSKTPQPQQPVRSAASQKPPALTPAQIDNFKYSLPPSPRSSGNTASTSPVAQPVLRNSPAQSSTDTPKPLIPDAKPNAKMNSPVVSGPTYNFSQRPESASVSSPGSGNNVRKPNPEANFNLNSPTTIPSLGNRSVDDSLAVTTPKTINSSDVRRSYGANPAASIPSGSIAKPKLEQQPTAEPPVLTIGGRSQNLPPPVNNNTAHTTPATVGIPKPIQNDVPQIRNVRANASAKKGVLLDGYVPLRQKDADLYRDGLETALDTPPPTAKVTNPVTVPNLACKATVYLMLERAHGKPNATINDYYSIGAGANNRPDYVANETKFDNDTVVASLLENRPVILHGYGGTLGEHYVLAVGITDSGDFRVNDPASGKLTTIKELEERNGYTFTKMQVTTAK